LTIICLQAHIRGMTLKSERGPAKEIQEKKTWDGMGIFLSLMCAAHCLATPFISLSLPLWVYSIHYSPVHLAMVIFIFPIGVYSFWTGFKKHDRKSILGMGWLGLALLALALLNPSSRNQLRGNDLMTLTGSFFLITAHALNFYGFRKSSSK